ncbi:nuclear receptor coactivator 5-like isoform X2 [Mya arenaria]|uniref:nuclear receptor coactivator 5-like isoform X2 n=1 Tax=Mya arenaria TaxID=6604 RepID=UPI0022E2C055|nr:nuclear receptor coactivator 5-like isoform X2 [Mya arenaria]
MVRRMGSRSRSRSPRERKDRFGRTVKRSRSRSASRSRSRSHSRDRYRRRSRSPNYGRGGSRERSHSRDFRFDRRRVQPSFRPPVEVTDRTNIEDPEFLNARLFIGNLPSDRTTKQDLENLFQSYGKILGVSIHDRGFGFVQFEKEEDARKAKDGEKGTKLNGSVLDVKMAAEGRKQGGRGRGRGDPGGRDLPPVGYGRDRSPVRDPYREPYGRGLPPPPPPRDDPYFADPYRRPPADDPFRDPYRDDPYRRDPYRRDPYEDPYRDPYFRDPYLPPPPPKKPVPADVQIICLNKQLIGYAESIEARLRLSALIVDIVIIPEDMQVPQMVEEASRLKFLFGIIINSQNESHKSLTLNILHGVPQEHRNMPLEDAMKLIATSFEKYIQTQREKVSGGAVAPAGVPPVPAAVAAPPPFLPPSADISYLLNLLADNRQLTVVELDKVLVYLRERKEKLIGPTARPAETVAPVVPAGVPPAGVPAPPAAAGSTSAYLQQQQQELQNKILNILNGTSSTNTPAQQTASQPAQAAMGYGSMPSAGAVRQQPQASLSQASPLINFDNPSVKKALDSLMQSGPNLLKSVQSNVPAAAPARPAGYPGSQPAAPAQARSQQPGYQQQGQFAAQTQQPSQQQQQASQSYGGQAQQPAQQGYGAQAAQQGYGAKEAQQGYGAQYQPQRGYGVQQPQRQPMGVRAPQAGARPRY